MTLFALFALFTLSCEKEETQDQKQENSSNIVQTAQNEDLLNSLVAALIKADESDANDLVNTLSGDGPFTVFAPTNDAFTALLGDLEAYSSLEDFKTEEDKAILATILKYHVVAGVGAKADDLENGQELTTVQGEKLKINLDGGVFIDDATDVNATVVRPDIEASNGIVHVIDKVMLPQAVIMAINGSGDMNLVEIVVATEPLSLLEEAVIKAGLVDTLSGDGPFTVFAPTNDAFVALLNTLGDSYNSLDDFDTDEEIALLKNILLYHVIPSKILAADLAEGSVPTAFADNSIEVIASGDTFVIGDASDVDANITGTDIIATNGVAHTIDKVLLPQAALDFVATLNLKTIVEIAVETDDLSLLVGALQQANAGLVDTLSGEGPFTVFAPTNAAFAALLDALGDDYNELSDFDTQEEKDLLVAILTYHVVSGTAAFSSDLSNGQEIPTVQGGKITVSLDGGVFIKDATETPAEVETADVRASNGVVHIIDKVLLPQVAVDFVNTLNLKTIVEIAVETDDLSLLVQALQQANAGLVDTLSGDGPFTVFAPTNAAFVALLNDLGDDYNSLADFDTQEEKDLLVQVLTYHVVSGTAAFSGDLSNGQQIPTVQGEKVGINIKNGTVHVEDATEKNATVVIPDVEASNGVVHVIDKVLLPQAVLDALTPALPNIVELAQSVDDLSLLVNALIQADAGLVDVLSGDGPFTVFAPTNAAFADLLDALGNEYHSLADFDTPEEKALLAKVLTYHVVSGTAAFAGDLSNGQQIPTVQGESVGINIKNGTVHIEDATDTNATVTGADNEASNGVVHIVNKVLLPQEVLDILNPPAPNIVELAQSVDDLSLLVDALIQADAGLVEVLSGDGPFTVFAPTNAAFADLLNTLGNDYNSLADFDTAEEKALLAKVLTYHVVSGSAIASGDFTSHQELVTVQGESLEAIPGHPIKLRDKTNVRARIIGADNEASNGIVHIIDKVVLPQEVLDILNPPTH
ncbi:fasciclin domain-containing protein [Costertonia aggregata]|uniref:Fasciclin domain-containing protein n=2 Tax=Costertonia aggregata TaxID=343403 RepID=A0A7H9AUW9_9FLAO|nr:fasciclin domain-containing protein [Costertonia aggregata]